MIEDLQDPDYGSTDNQLRKNAKRLSLLLKHFQGRWRHEYLTSLREFHKSQGNNNQTAKVGDIVQIHDEGSRLGWRLAVIEELITGNDGLVRAANICTSTGRTNRPIVKLYPLEVVSAETLVPTTQGTLHDDTPDDSQKKDPIVPQKRPSRLAAERAKGRITDWIKAIRAPPEDVRNASDIN